MPVSIGTTTITALFLGTTSITSAYLGSTQVFGGSFTPLSLFSGGAQGVWYDPSDLTTMFVDRAGTTPVTSPGQLVGLRLDKSKGLALGADTVVNGSFGTGTTSSWVESIVGGTITVASGVVTINNVAGTGNTGIHQDVTVPANSYVQVTYTVGGTQPLAIFTNGANFTANMAVTETVGAKSLILGPVTSGIIRMRFLCNATKTATATAITCKVLAGNHAVAPTDAARPMYGVEPKGGRRNLLTWSEDFGNAVWVKGPTGTGTVSVTANQGTAPNLETTADRVVLSLNGGTTSSDRAYVSQTTSADLGVYSIWLKSYDGVSSYSVAIDGAGASVVTVTGSWQRFTVAKGSSTSVGLFLRGNYAVSNAVDLLVWGAQLELGSTATNYQRVTIAEDVTEAGVPTCHYCRYDGANNSMSTAAIDFTATDKMSVFAGVTKLGTTAYPVLAELGIGVSSGGFVWHANGAGSSTVFLGNYTSPTAAAFFSDGGANQTYVGSVLLNRGGTSGALSEIAFRKNAVAISGAQDGSLSDSTGNYGNLAWFIGRRNNTSLPFNGRDFGIIVVGKAASAGEITDTETWLAARTSGVTL